MSQIVKEEKLVYTAQEVAKILHASPNYVYELIRKGKLKAFKLKSIRILKSALEDFIKQNEGNDLSDIDNVRRLSKYDREYFEIKRFICSFTEWNKKYIKDRQNS